MNLHEDAIMQINRLFATKLYNDNFLDFDDNGLIRIDDLELKDEVQNAVFAMWNDITSENLRELTDYDGYKKAFLGLFGFGVDGVEYGKDSKVQIDF